MTDADVIIVGAGPVGLMLAGELGLAGVRPLVLERQPQLREAPKASGLGGRILQLLRYRGLWDQLEEAAGGPGPPARRFPFGEIHLDFTDVSDPPLQALPLAQPELERLLDRWAGQLGADIRRGQELVGIGRDDDGVTAEVRGPEGPRRVRARFLVGCDGARSTVRGLAGVPFPGTTYPEVNRFVEAAVPASVVRRDDGDLDVPGAGRVPAGFTRTAGGAFGLGSRPGGALALFTSEDETTEYDDDVPMTVPEFEASIRRVLGMDLRLEAVTRMSRFTFQARQVDRYRDGRILLAGDAAHLFPATGAALNVGMLDAVNLAWKLAAELRGWAPAGLLDTYHHERHRAGARALLQTQAQVALRRGHDPAAEALREVLGELLVDEQPLRRLGALIAGTDVRYPLSNPNHHPLTGTFAPDLTLRTDSGPTSVAELMHPARPVLLDLADRPDLRRAARGWQPRLDVQVATTEDRPADALLIRPDAHIAWAATIDQPTGSAGPELSDALATWFGVPPAAG